MGPASDAEIEFHLAALLVDLRALSHLAGVHRDAWLSTVQPLIAHAAGVCLALSATIDDGAVAADANALAVAIGSVSPPGSTGVPSGVNDPAWGEITKAHRRLTAHFRTRKLQPWVFGRES